MPFPAIPIDRHRAIARIRDTGRYLVILTSKPANLTFPRDNPVISALFDVVKGVSKRRLGVVESASVRVSGVVVSLWVPAVVVPTPLCGEFRRCFPIGGELEAEIAIP